MDRITHAVSNGTPQATVPPDRKAQRKHQEENLDEALRESFPASDPLPVDPGTEKE